MAGATIAVANDDATSIEMASELPSEEGYLPNRAWAATRRAARHSECPDSGMNVLAPLQKLRRACLARGSE